MVSEVIISGSGYWVAFCDSQVVFGGESGWSVVDDDAESSKSDVVDGVGELARKDRDDESVLRFLDRIFCVILV